MSERLPIEALGGKPAGHPKWLKDRRALISPVQADRKSRPHLFNDSIPADSLKKLADHASHLSSVSFRHICWSNRFCGEKGWFSWGNKIYL